MKRQRQMTAGAAGGVTLWRPRVLMRYMDMYVWDRLTINLVDMQSMATCIRKPVERLRPQRLLGKTSAFPLLPGRKKAAAANTSTAGATAAVEIWGAGAYSHSAPHPPLPPPPSASRPLLFVYSLRYPSGRRRRRRHQSPIRSKLDSMVKHTHALSSTQG